MSGIIHTSIVCEKDISEESLEGAVAKRLEGWKLYRELLYAGYVWEKEKRRFTKLSI